jgi:RHH-type proline utilization regulon transcriptional repressor/proline dehydrogenase/delta 1-pyrroline-5-carboxylate dehydrogenase
VKAIITEKEAQHYQQENIDVIEGLSRHVNAWPANDRIDRDDRGPIPRVNVSLKLSSLYSQFDPIDPAGTSRAVRQRLRPIFRTARAHGAFVNVDMEQYAYKDLTLRIFKEVLEEDEFRDWPDVGIAIQVYLRDTERDLHDLAAWAGRRGPVWVRLIKGAYWDFETVMAEQLDWPVPVFTHKGQTDANFEKLTRFLLENYRVLRPAFGSHNVRSVAHALATADVLGLPRGSIEFQMLYGMADPVKDALVSLGQRVRVYTPYGQLLPGMAYLVRRLLENTANESFLRASFTERVPEEQLLMNPSRSVNGPLTAPAPQRDGTLFRNEPVTDFSRAEARQAMQAALQQVAGQFGRTYLPVIDGRTVAAATMDATNPSHLRQHLGKIGRATTAQANEAITAAARGR